MAKARKIWDNCKDIGEVKKSPSTKLIVQLCARDGVKYVNIRGMYKRKADNQWKFGLDGFAVPIELPIDGVRKFVTADLMNLIAEACNASGDFALEDEENAVWAEPKK